MPPEGLVCQLLGERTEESRASLQRKFVLEMGCGSFDSDVPI